MPWCGMDMPRAGTGIGRGIDANKLREGIATRLVRLNRHFKIWTANPLRGTGCDSALLLSVSRRQRAPAPIRVGWLPMAVTTTERTADGIAIVRPEAQRLRLIGRRERSAETFITRTAQPPGQQALHRCAAGLPDMVAT